MEWIGEVLIVILQAATIGIVWPPPAREQGPATGADTMTEERVRKAAWEMLNAGMAPVDVAVEIWRACKDMMIEQKVESAFTEMAARRTEAGPGKPQNGGRDWRELR
jgi:hypothetical protein